MATEFSNNSYATDKENAICEFPNALFSESEKMILMRADFTEKEQELFQLLTWYAFECGGYNNLLSGGSFIAVLGNDNIKKIPYEYLKEEGIINTRRRIAILSKKLSDSLILTIDRFLQDNPGKLFSIENMSPKDFLFYKLISTREYIKDPTISILSTIRYIENIYKESDRSLKKFTYNRERNLAYIFDWIKIDKTLDTIEITDKGKEMIDWINKYNSYFEY